MSSSSSSSSKAFEPVRVGRWDLPQRFVMAPLTRNRSPETVPTELNATYYGQRAGAGLIVSEGTQPSAVGQGYPGTPGIHSADAGRRLAQQSPTPCTPAAAASSCS